MFGDAVKSGLDGDRDLIRHLIVLLLVQCQSDVMVSSCSGQYVEADQLQILSFERRQSYRPLLGPSFWLSAECRLHRLDSSDQFGYTARSLMELIELPKLRDLHVLHWSVEERDHGDAPFAVDLWMIKVRLDDRRNGLLKRVDGLRR